MRCDRTLDLDVSVSMRDLHASDSMRACIGFDAARVNRKCNRTWMLWVRSKVTSLEVSTFLDLLESGCVLINNHFKIITRDARNVLMDCALLWDAHRSGIRTRVLCGDVAEVIGPIHY